MIDISNISVLINLTIASLQLKSIELPTRKLKRTNLHIILYGKVGTTKSSILYKVAEKMQGNVIKGLTKANLLGTMDKTTKMVIPPAIWECRNNFLFIDEYYLNCHDKGGRELINELLSVMENTSYSRNLSYTSSGFNEKEGDLYCKIEKNRIKVNTKFSLFLNTMMTLDATKIYEFEPLKSRCLCIPLYFDRPMLSKIADGLKLYQYKHIKAKKINCKINIKKYAEIKAFVDNSTTKDTRYLRRIEDLCRIYAILGKIDAEIFNLVLSLP